MQLYISSKSDIIQRLIKEKKNSFAKRQVQKTTKKDLRERIITLLSNQEEEERLTKSLSIGDKLFYLPAFQEAGTILFYFSFDGEVHTIDMINRAKELGKTIGLPRVVEDEKKIVPTMIHDLEEDLEDGPYGIKQPKGNQDNTLSLENIDMVIVPAVAFDKDNNRLGRGGGYYDRFLKTLASDTPTVGLAFDFQVVEHIPHLQEHDVAVSSVIVN